jgi:hypothetical protein
MTDRIKFTVWRDRWSRGRKSQLLASDGMMCCLGFLGKACGAADDDILHGCTPSYRLGVRWPAGLLKEYNNDSDICEQIIEVNDGPFQKLREPQLAALFDSIGIDVTFADGTGEP